MLPPRSDFPAGFVFGAATAAYQIEGAGFGGAGPSHWDSFAATPGNIADDSSGARACDHYHLWETDLDLMRNAGFGAYRFSTSWARVMPDGRRPNPEGLDFYDRLVDGMLARGLAPFLTLYHWDLPAALADRGGWRNRDIAGWFADYALAVHARLGDRVASTATLNEPWCIAWLSHFLGHHAPGLRDIRAASRAMHHVLLAHGTAMAALRAEGAQDLGIVLNFETAHPADDIPGSAEAAATHDAIYNQWFIRALTGQGYPQAALAGIGPHLPQGWQDDMGLIAQPLDWLGVNYYTRGLHAHAPGLWPNDRSVAGPLPKTQMGWEIRPEGLAEFLLRLSRDHVGDLPIFVTENGMALEPGADVTADPARIDFIAGHLRAAREALAQGVNLRGFFYWSLLDNYEWAFGYGPRFGLVHVDYDSMARSPKASWHAFRQMLAQGRAD
ncbi:GH1 family beta-glucosidase [Paracoccus spongiarum]|uniref:Beta-glucosidase n=1 Tax=Paracoccus spongiarum TaxID=3064387 RepID=A0ABT9JDT6_9RHOB|nr:GH1 family beta-glucosidase [Paracoccus sp. 2205BS29-5]MDP5307246.1 GH1 family beta-glucosidase [Paracoccus sp. 2205BS29-5]